MTDENTCNDLCFLKSKKKKNAQIEEEIHDKDCQC